MQSFRFISAIALVLLCASWAPETSAIDVDSLTPLELGSLVPSELPAAREAESMALDINASNVVVGYAATITGELHAFRWQDGSIRALPRLAGAIDSGATAINDRGAIVGQSSWDDGRRRATLWQDETAIDLGTLGGPSSMAWDINSTGSITGWAETADGERHAFSWSDGVMQDLGTLGGPSSEGYAIDENGVVVGMSLPSTGAPQPFVYERGFIRLLPGEGSSLSGYAVDIAPDGAIVGVIIYEDGTQTAAIWREGVLTTVLQELNPLLNPGAILLTETTAVGTDGMILGSAGQSGAAVLVEGRVRMMPNLDSRHHGGIAQATNANGWIIGMTFIDTTLGPIPRATIWVPMEDARALQPTVPPVASPKIG